MEDCGHDVLRTFFCAGRHVPVESAAQSSALEPAIHQSFRFPAGLVASTRDNLIDWRWVGLGAHPSLVVGMERRSVRDIRARALRVDGRWSGGDARLQAPLQLRRFRPEKGWRGRT